MQVLVVAAHPDDEVLGVGGTIAKYAQRGDKVFVCILTEGCTAQYEDKKMIIIKKRESKRVNEILGIEKTFFFDLPDMQLDTLPHIKINECIEKCIKEVHPEVIFTHYRGDLNKDHRLVFESTMVATRVSEVKIILSYEVPSSTELGGVFGISFTPNVYMDISETLPKKLEAMKAYQSEIREYPHLRSLKALEIIAKRWGINIGVKASEAFILVKGIDVI